MPSDDPYEILGVPPEAGEEEIRAAYLRKIKEHPPDRAPELFERVRDAYSALRDPRQRTRDRLFSGDPMPPLEKILDGRRAARHFVGPKPWLAVLKEK